jgi:hypothetical protein
MGRISSRDAHAGPHAPSVDESLDDAFADRMNGLTTLRMTLACLVLLSHSYVFGGRGHDPLTMRSVDTVTIADVALASCIILCAFVIAPFAWILDKGTLAGFLSQPESPLGFVTKNALLGL